MKYLYNISLIVLSLLIFWSCDNGSGPKEELESQKKFGQLSLSSINVDLDRSSNLSRATAQEISDFIITITSEDNEQVLSSRYADLSETIALEVGEYNITVRSYSKDNEPAKGFNIPCYYGEQSFSIEENKVTELQPIECDMVNIKVGVSFSQNLSLGDDVTVKVINESTNDELVFTKENINQSGYFKISKGESTSLKALFSGTVEGNILSESTVYSDVKGGEYYVFTYDMKSLDPGPFAK